MHCFTIFGSLVLFVVACCAPQFVCFWPANPLWGLGPGSRGKKPFLFFSRAVVITVTHGFHVLSGPGPPPQLGISPATPDIVRKPARPSGTTAADGSCCTALFTSAGTGEVEGDDGFATVPSNVQEQSQSMSEDLGQVDCALVNTQESSTMPVQMGESSGKVAQQKEEDAANDSDTAAAAPPVPTPDKAEPIPRRWKKKSTKGVLWFKVVKDKVMKPKVTPKRTTPRKVNKKMKMPEDGNP